MAVPPEDLLTANPPDPTATDAYDGDENTDGAVAFERAVAAAEALAGLPPAPEDGQIEASDTTPQPLQWVRVVVLLLVVGIAWLAMMVWDQFIVG